MKYFYLVILLPIILAACQSGPIVVTERVKSETVGTILTPTAKKTQPPTTSRTPVPTRTLTPTTAPPEMLTEFLEGVQIAQTDTFEGNTNWDTYPSGEVYIRDGKLTINGTSPWNSSSTYKSSLGEGDGVYFDFTYSQGPEYEMYYDVGKWQTDTYRRFGVYGYGNPRSNLWQGLNAIGGGYLVGNLGTRPDTWYSILMAIGDDAEFLAVIWDPKEPSKYLVYNEIINEKWVGKTWKFRFGANQGTINIDNFGQFTFESIK